MKTNYKYPKTLLSTEANHAQDDLFRLLNTPFVNMLKELITHPQNAIAISKLEGMYREFIGSLYTCFGAGIHYLDLYRLASLTKIELIMLKTRFVRTESGKKCACCT